MPKAKKILKKSGRILLYVVLGILGLVLAAFLLLNTQPGKKIVRNQVEKYLQNKLKTEVSIGSVDYSLPEWLELRDVFFRDQNKDTLFFGKQLSVDLNMLKLIGGNTDIQKIYLNNIYANIRRGEADSNFNYQYIVDAFTGNKSSTTIKDTAEMKLTMDRLVFDTVVLDFDDKNAGTKFLARINNLNSTLTRFQPDRLNFAIDSFYARGVHFDMLSYKASKPDTTHKIPTDSALAEPTYGLYLTAKNFRLRDVYVNVENTVNNMLYRNDVKNLLLTGATYNLEQSIVLADTARLDSSFIKFVQPKPDVAKENVEAVYDTATSAPLFVKAGYLKINNVAAQYDDLAKPRQGGFDPAHINATNLNLDVSGFLLSEDSTTAFISQLAFADSSGFRIDSTTADILFTDTVLRSNALYLRTPRSLIQGFFELDYDSLAAIIKSPQNTLLNAKLNQTLIAFDDIYTLMPALKKSFPPAQFAGNKVRLNTELRGTMQRIYLPYLELKGLSGSTISARGNLYNLTDAKRFAYDLYILSSRVLKKDLLKFVPKENQASLASLPDIINLSGHLEGDMVNLKANVNANSRDFNYKGLIVLNDFTDPAKLRYDLNASNITLSKRLVEGYIPPAALANISLPERISASGKFKGSTNDFVADLKLNTSYGNAAFKGFMKGFKTNPDNAEYNFEINTPGFDVGRLIKNDSIGILNGYVSMKGRGFDYKTMNSDLLAKINSIGFNGYTYRNIHADAKFRNGTVDAKGNINDPNLVTDFDFVANVTRDYPTINGYINVDTALLGRIGLVKDTLNFSSYWHLAANNTTPRQLDVNIWTDSLNLQTSEGIFHLDSIALRGSSENGIDDITFNSPFAYAHAKGAFDYDKIGPVITQYINHYYRIAPPQDISRIPDQQLDFEAYFAKHPIVTAFVPGLHDYDSIQLQGSYSSAYGDSALSLNASIPYVLYNDYTLRAGDIKIGSKNEQLNYNIVFDTLIAGGRKFFGTEIKGAAAKDSVSFNALTQDDFGKNWFGAEAVVFLAQDGNYNVLLEDSLLLNYERWEVSPGNKISFGPNGYHIDNFRINSDTSIIEIRSTAAAYNSPILANIDNFDLNSITSFLNKDTLLMSGILDAQIEVSDFQKEIPAFTGTAQIRDLQVFEQPLGTLAMSTEKVGENTITGRANLNGYGNLINSDLTVNLNDANNQFRANLDIERLQFSTLQGLSKGQLKDATGSMRGNLALNGKLSDPRWNGELVFDTSRFTITQLGAPYVVDNQKIVFDYPYLRLNNFTIEDSLQNKLVVNGTVESKTISDYKLDLGIKADDFNVMNTNKAIANTLYGNASIDGNLRITGTAESPDIDGNALINKNSHIKLVLPDRNYSKDEGLDVVKFIDTDTIDIFHPPASFTETKDNSVPFARFLNYNLNIEVDKDAIFTIIVDPSTGDALNVQGEALLNAGVDPGGNLILGGTYTLEKGDYELSYQFIKRKFELEKGSTIVFVGQPMDARVDIAASYFVNTSSKNLIGSQVTENLSQLNQQLPFKVNLFIDGPLSKPNIKFGIDLVEEGSGLVSGGLRSTIQNKLSQMADDEAAINKQVFSLLLLGRFVNEQSTDFFAGNGGSFEDIARQSVTQFLSEALDQIAADLVKGVDIDLTLNSYRDFSSSSTGNQRTDLNITVSKNFMDDRLTLSIGNNFGLEGQDAVSRANAGNNTSSFNPNVSATYKLTKDGKYLLRAYRKNEFEVTVDGYVVETGLSFILVLDYDSFKGLFKKKK